jgi:hypothetical protein
MSPASSQYAPETWSEREKIGDRGNRFSSGEEGKYGQKNLMESICVGQIEERVRISVRSGHRRPMTRNHLRRDREDNNEHE